MTTELQRPPHDNRIDILKGVAIFGVVCIHFGGSFVVNNNSLLWTPIFYLGLFISQFFSFSVPLFIFLSGWLLELHYGHREIRWGGFYKKRLLKLGIPYLTVVAAYFILFGDSQIIQSITPSNFLLKFFYFGIQGTLYFVSLIVQLYFLYPVLRWLTKRSHNLFYDRQGLRGLVGESVILILFAVLHVAIGLLSYQNYLDYYIYCRPFSPFWVFYFYAGMNFPKLMSWLNTQRKINYAIVVLIVGVIIQFVRIYVRMIDTGIVGPLFEHSPIYHAYDRPEVLFFNFTVLLLAGTVLLKPWNIKARWIETMGMYAYQIYIWHLIILMYSAWFVPPVMKACEQQPEIIIIIILAVCITIAWCSRQYDYFKAWFMMHFRRVGPPTREARQG